MSLTSRLSLYFLTSLALVLLGFSSVLYLLVSRHVIAQADQRLHTAMETLVAATEIHPGDVMWEPLERRVRLGDEEGPDQIRWMLHDSTGRLVDCSRNLETWQSQDAGLAPGGQDWRLLVRRVRAGHFDAEPVGPVGTFQGSLSEGVAVSQLPAIAALQADRTCTGTAFVLRAGLPWHPISASLRQLAWALTAVSTTLWLAGALLSRFVCRRALKPVIQMASSARQLPVEETNRLLAVPTTGDELEDLGQAFNGVLTRLWEAMERQQRFTTGASHQLRTPLAALLGQVEVALRQPRDPAEYERVLRLVERRGRQMTQIVELLLFLARKSAETQLPEIQCVNLVEWLEEHLQTWSDHPRAADIRCTGPAGDRPWNVTTQPVLLAQLLDNLLDNACKYSDPGTPIQVTLDRQEDAIELAVTDRGLGIAAEELPHLCDPFYRSPEARRRGYPGFGLGLAVVQEIARILGCTLRIRSQPGKGSCFSLLLPADSPAGQGQKPLEDGAQSKMTVLRS